MLTVGGIYNTVWKQVLAKIVCKTSYMQWSPSNADTVGTTTACLEYGGGCILKFLVGMAV